MSVYTESRFLLSGRTNPNSPVRSNGVRFWGHPERDGGLDAIRCVVVHTAETDPSPASAENVARWQAFTAPTPSSYHVLVDSDSIVRTLLDRAVAFHAVGLNTPSLGLSFGTRAAWWGRFPVWDREALVRGAWVAARWSALYSIPLRWITKAQAEAGARGFIRHSTWDPSRRTDPGSGFPAGEFFRLAGFALADPSEEAEMITDEDLDRIAARVATYQRPNSDDRHANWYWRQAVSRASANHDLLRVIHAELSEVAKKVGVDEVALAQRIAAAVSIPVEQIAEAVGKRVGELTAEDFLDGIVLRVERES